MRNEPLSPFEQIGRLLRDGLHAALWLLIVALVLVVSVALAFSHAGMAP